MGVVKRGYPTLEQVMGESISVDWARQRDADSPILIMGESTSVINLSLH